MDKEIRVRALEGTRKVGDFIEVCDSSGLVVAVGRVVAVVAAGAGAVTLVVRVLAGG